MSVVLTFGTYVAQLVACLVAGGAFGLAGGNLMKHAAKRVRTS